MCDVKQLNFTNTNARIAVIAETSPLASASTLVGIGGKDLEWWARRLIDPGASPQPVFDCLGLRQNKLTVKSGYSSWLGKYNPFQWLNDDSFFKLNGAIT